MKIDARLTFDKIRHDQDFDAHLVLSLTAPTVEVGEKRSRICIIPVIDVSPSMQGQKLDYAKKSVLKLIDHLHTGDYCGLVQFSGRAQVIMRPTKITAESKDDLKRKVGDLRIGSATNIADALLVGLELANKADLPGEVITRVILFTDGEANTGVAIRDAEILKLVEPSLGLASVSAFGYGMDAKQDLLRDIAKLGKANYAFVQNPDDALSAFGKELGGLLSTYATDLEIEVKPLAGHTVTKIISDVEAEEEEIGGEVTIKIPDILGEETRHIVMGVKLSAQKQAFPRAVNVFDVKASYDILDPNSRKERKDADAKVKVQFVKPGEEQDKPDKDLDQIVGLAQVVRSQIEAEEFAKKGQYVQAQAVMRHTADAVQGRGHANLHRLASNVSARLSSSRDYHDGAAYLASVGRGGTRGMGVASYDASAQADLEANGVVLSNCAQTSTSNSFNDGHAGVPAVVPAVHIAPQPLNAGSLFTGQPSVNPVDLGAHLGGASVVGLGVGLPNATLGVSSSSLGGAALGGASWTSGSLDVSSPPAPTPPTTNQVKDSKKKSKQKKSSRW